MVNSTCPMPKEAFDYNDKGTAHHTMVLVALACLGITTISSLSLITLHLQRYRCPKEQRQIIRIIFIAIVYAAVSFFQIYDYAIAQYLDVIPAMYESFCLCALYLLYLQFAAPAGTFGDELFQAVREAEEHHTGFDWPRITWIFVFQFPITQLIVTVITVSTEAANRYCLQSLSPQFGHIWAEILNSVGVGAAVLAIFRMYKHIKSIMKARRGLSKLVCFKIIVAISFLQAWIFSILLEHNVMKPSKTFSYDDLMWGIPALLLSCEMVLFSAAFWYAYSSTEYSSDAKPREHRMPIYKAVFDAMNPYDLLHGIVQMFNIIFHLQRTGGFKQWSAVKAENKRQKQANSSSGGRRGPIGMVIGAASNLRNKGRYQTMDGMESLSRPSQSHYRNESEQSATGYPATGYNAHQMYQPPRDSPPSYDPAKQFLMAEGQPVRSSSPGGRRSSSPGSWNGQTYGRTPSPGGRSDKGSAYPRDMV